MRQWLVCHPPYGSLLQWTSLLSFFGWREAYLPVASFPDSLILIWTFLARNIKLACSRNPTLHSKHHPEAQEQEEEVPNELRGQRNITQHEWTSSLWRFHVEITEVPSSVNANTSSQLAAQNDLRYQPVALERTRIVIKEMDIVCHRKYHIRVNLRAVSPAHPTWRKTSSFFLSYFIRSMIGKSHKPELPLPNKFTSFVR